jgi:hypothetical protein
MMFLVGLLAVGCHDSGPAEADVSGIVTVKGKPLTGGVVTFVSEKGVQNSATIDETGHYSIRVGVGQNKIAIDNRMMKKGASDQGGNRKNAQRVETPRLKTPEAQRVIPPGTYMPISDNYTSVETSRLTCDVAPGSQNRDFSLE